MKALLCTRLGTPDVLEVADLPVPRPGPGQIVVEVAYVGLNFHDTLVVAGRHVVKPDPPFSPGSEYSGVVTAVGDGVQSVAVGDRVVGNEEYGCAREFLLVRADRVTVLPDGVSDKDAATVLVAYATAYHALVQRAGLRPGETLVVLGAAGGVGSAAVDVGRLLGAEVIACASSPERARAALAQGAGQTLSYGEDGIKERIKAATAGRGADVVFDPVGGDVAAAAVRATAWRGRYLVVGFASGAIPSVGLNIPMVKGASVVGVFLGEFVRRERDVHEGNLARIFAWSRNGDLSPHVHAVLPLEEGAAALTELATGQVRGKVLLRVGGRTA
ncbi:NADPH:quinone oxidoreductase [Streptomyces violaceusniger]|uniref:NADPH:quinone oxidoreductase family protein n=2 Tax=Streptomyces violaceusniger group TaxID=2839105 RepID=A0ABD5JFL8_9ACTN|nr:MULTISPECIES: NADPH:quinone oxidoreductase family protein [Streptomyces]KUL66405.1 NADPH:quinone oxidoreductase [Streptomyces violaceusniger]MEE4587213.1 NADPH:quinone oxidoreductase family protein [Streptomyces sp. DSM 41602]WJD96348.1 NADPH:quinone oxidoreductase family protein [Streptomyces antimycoticus]